FFLLVRPAALKAQSLAEVERELAGGAVLLDVRSQEEFERAHAEGALNMPLNILKLKSRLLDPRTRYVAYCNSGRRSGAAAHLLGEEGFDVTVLRGGYEALALPQRLRLLTAGDPVYLAREQLLIRDESAGR